MFRSFYFWDQQEGFKFEKKTVWSPNNLESQGRGQIKFTIIWRR